MPLPEPARFCPRCGSALSAGTEEGACPRDGYRWYPDPKVAVGVLVSDLAPAVGSGRQTITPSPTLTPQGRGGQTREPWLLLVRRNHEPAVGAWAFPSGFVDAGEVLEEAAIREVREETNVDVALDGLLGAWSSPGNPVVFLAYAGHPVAGEPAAGDEAFEVGWFPVGTLPELAFDHDFEIVEAWREWVSAQRAREGIA